ncbi:hypothetical protein OPV22_013462 [Ensete ventricosum]|uniref:Uncharacterized protein n=1 Tax=Ensete ventricosum TaxID=4639 RepID=A0AAV8R4Z6_ENSVE|nr:hypothetical protein OPV22_013462 [Ensete ventricosum]
MCPRPEQLDEQDFREWVRNKLDTKGVRPFHFAQTVSPFDPPCALAETSTSGHCGNPQNRVIVTVATTPISS